MPLFLCPRWRNKSDLFIYLNATQFNLPFLTPFSVAGCGRLQLGVTPWATSVALLKVVDI